MNFSRQIDFPVQCVLLFSAPIERLRWAKRISWLSLAPRPAVYIKSEAHLMKSAPEHPVGIRITVLKRWGSELSHRTRTHRHGSSTFERGYFCSVPDRPPGNVDSLPNRFFRRIARKTEVGSINKRGSVQYFLSVIFKIMRNRR
jgi:hypothetical protein